MNGPRMPPACALEVVDIIVTVIEEPAYTVFAVIAIFATPGTPASRKMSTDLVAHTPFVAVHGFRRGKDYIHVGTHHPAGFAEGIEIAGAFLVVLPVFNSVICGFQDETAILVRMPADEVTVAPLRLQVVLGHLDQD